MFTQQVLKMYIILVWKEDVVPITAGYQRKALERNPRKYLRVKYLFHTVFSVMYKINRV